MSEREPIDEKFARVLQDAEATPPPRVWENIARERGWAHVTMLRLQRRWGLLALLLLLGGAGAYRSAFHEYRPALAMEQNGASVGRADSQGYTAQGRPIEALAVTMNETTEPTVPVPSAMAPPKNEGATNELPTTDMASAQGGGSTVLILVSQSERSDKPIAQYSGTVVQVAPTADQPIVDLVLTATGGDQDVKFVNDPVSSLNAMPAASERERASIAMLNADLMEGNTSSASEDAVAKFLQVRHSELLQTPALATPVALSTMDFFGPQRAWWLAATVGQFRESRTWHGSDAVLVEGLQSTELTHFPVGLGVLVGFENRSGWGMAVGLEYNAGRYTYRHLDQFVQRTDSLVPFVVTFNSDVIESYSDTLSTFTDQRRPVATENRYTTVRIPVEASWHTGWRRWHVGARAGLALEINTQLAGATLVEATGGTQSVDVSSTPVARTSTMLGGSLAADLGYGLTERIGIWVSPTYASGLRSLSVKGDASYAIPERIGLRFRLAYTFCPRP